MAPEKAHVSESPRARISDVIGDLDNNHQPNIVHLSAHGSPTSQIILFDEDDKPRPIPRAAIQRLFLTLKGQILPGCLEWGLLFQTKAGRPD